MWPLVSMVILCDDSDTGSLSEDEGREGGEGGSGSEGEGSGEVDEEEQEWKSLQQSMKIQQQKKKEMGANRDSYPVHAPFFPDVSHYIVLHPLAHVIVT